MLFSQLQLRVKSQMKTSLMDNERESRNDIDRPCAVAEEIQMQENSGKLRNSQTILGLLSTSLGLCNLKTYPSF